MFLIDRSFWEVHQTRKKGRGVFAQKKIIKGTLIGDYVGKLLALNEIDLEKEKKNMYLMYYDDNTGIYPDLRKHGIHLLNHSCSPNCFIKKYKKHTLVFAIRDIQQGEELTIHYLLPPKEYCVSCIHQCFCGSENCTGTMHLAENTHQKWQAFQKIRGKKTGNLKFTKKVLHPLKNYPSFVSRKYIKEINGIFKLSRP